MNKKIRWITAVFFVIVTCVMTFIGTFYYMSQKTLKLSKTENLFSKLTAINDLVNTHYIGTPDNQILVENMLKGYVEGLGDVYAEYFTKEEYRLYTKDRSGQFEGIGIKTLPSKDEKSLYIHYVHSMSPAGKSGVKAGDHIIAVGDEAVADIGYDASVEMLRGKVGTLAKFTVLRNEKEILFEVKREAFDKTTVEGKIAGDVAIIRILEFDQKTPEFFGKVLEELLEQDPLYFIFDVRYNPGGDLNSVQQVLDYLLPPSIIMTAEEKPQNKSGSNDNTHIKYYKTVDDTELEYPMAVLINEDSASGAEIFASSLKAYKQAVLVGKITFGKGVGQSIISMPDGSALKITTFKYLPAVGESFDGIGITPDIDVAFPSSLYNIFYMLAPVDDPQLAEAAKALGGSLVLAEGENESEELDSSSMSPVTSGIGTSSK